MGNEIGQPGQPGVTQRTNNYNSDNGGNFSARHNTNQASYFSQNPKGLITDPILEDNAGRRSFGMMERSNHYGTSLNNFAQTNPDQLKRSVKFDPNPVINGRLSNSRVDKTPEIRSSLKRNNSRVLDDLNENHGATFNRSLSRSALRYQENFYADAVKSKPHRHVNEVSLLTSEVINANKVSIFGEDLYKPKRHVKSTNIFLKDGNNDKLPSIAKQETIPDTARSKKIDFQDFDALIKQGSTLDSGSRLDPNKIRQYSKGRKQQKQNQNIYIQNLVGDNAIKESLTPDLRRSFTPLARSIKDQEMFKSSIQTGRYDPRSPAPKQLVPQMSTLGRPNSRPRDRESNRPNERISNRPETPKRFDNEFDPFRANPSRISERRDDFANADQRGFNPYPTSLSNFNDNRNGDITVPVTLRLANGSVYTGSVENGIPQGHGTETMANGDYYEGGYRSGQRHGEGVFKKRGEYEYVGMFRFGQFHGKGTKSFTNGNVFNGEFKDGLEEGYGELKDTVGRTIKKGLWVNGSFAS